MVHMIKKEDSALYQIRIGSKLSFIFLFLQKSNMS